MRPKIEASLLDAPPGAPQHRLKAGTGTRYDFNIHAKCVGPTPFPAGIYVFKYRASCEYDIFKSADIFDLDDVMTISLPQDDATPADNKPRQIATETSLA